MADHYLEGRLPHFLRTQWLTTCWPKNKRRLLFSFVSLLWTRSVTWSDYFLLSAASTLGSRGYSLSENWGRKYERRGAGGEAEPRRETSGNKCRWSHFHAAMIDSWRYVAALWTNSPGWINSVVQVLTLRVFRSPAASTEDLQNVELEKDEFMSLRTLISLLICFGDVTFADGMSSLLWSKKCRRLRYPLFPMNWYYICLLSCFVSVVCLGLVIPAPFAMPSDCEVKFW